MNEAKKAIRLTITFIILLGIIYPVLITMISHLLFPEKASGSLVYNNEVLVGSKLIGQKFTEDKWFQGRPSAVDYDASKSGGSNLALSNPKFMKNLDKNIQEFLAKNPTVKKKDIPADAVTASASGLDSEISVNSAKLQADRVAKANGMTLQQIDRLIEDNKTGKFLGIFGEERVNVLTLNMKLLNK